MDIFLLGIYGKARNDLCITTVSHIWTVRSHDIFIGTISQSLCWSELPEISRKFPEDWKHPGADISSGRPVMKRPCLLLTILELIILYLCIRGNRCETEQNFACNFRISHCAIY